MTLIDKQGRVICEGTLTRFVKEGVYSAEDEELLYTRYTITLAYDPDDKKEPVNDDAVRDQHGVPDPVRRAVGG